MFRLGTYKEHREKVSADREKARLPATQEDAAAYKRAFESAKQIKEELAPLHAEYARISGKIYELERTCARLNQVTDSFGRIRLVDGTPTKEKKPEPVAFVKPCPAPECKGFLSTAWKCGLCNMWTCPDCHDLKGLVRDVEHRCEPEKVATATLLAREAKGCPKCGVQICKIEGCDQMWCTVCNTGFNWRTGKIAEGPVHNPHYFEWLRSQGRDPTLTPEVPMNCDNTMDRRVVQALGNPTANYYYAGYRTRAQREDTHENYLTEAWRLMREAQDHYIHEMNPEEEFRILRVKYMVGEITEEAWKTVLQRHEKDANFQQAKRNVREVFVNACRDLIRQVLEDNHDKVAIRRQVAELIEYCNGCYTVISRRFGRKTQLIEIKLEEPKPAPVATPALSGTPEPEPEFVEP